MSRDFSRQSDLVPETKLIDPIDVIGCGAVGRNVALMLASLGARRVRLFDFDVVDASNVTTQGFLSQEIGSKKTNAVSQAMQLVDDSIVITSVSQRWSRKVPLSPRVFSCVDTMAVRGEIFRASGSVEFVADGRMLGEVGFVYTYGVDTLSREAYAATLFHDSEAEPGRCTQKSTLYCASTVASTMIYQFVRHIRGQAPFNCGGLMGQWAQV